MVDKFDVIVVGSSTIDLTFSGMSEFLQLGKDIQSKEFILTPGESFISAVSMHRLGIKVGWAVDFGNDDFSRYIINQCRNEGLDETLFVFHDRPYRRISVSASYPGDNAFLTYYDPDPLIPAAIPALTKFHAKVVFIPGLIFGSLMEAGVKLIRLSKSKLVMDGNSSNGCILGNSSESKSIRKAIQNTDIFLPNSREAKRLTNETDVIKAIQILGEFCPCVVVKNGTDGSLAYMEGNLIQVPSIPVKSRDTTGAGDNYNAGFLRALLDNQSMETCLKWGNISGGLSTTELGGTTCRISIHTIQEAMAKYYSL